MPHDPDEPHPPPAPEIRRSLHLHPWQWIGVPLLLLIPLLALLGLFGESRQEVSDRTAELGIQMSFPTRYRYKMTSSLAIGVTNRTAGRLDTVTVQLDTAYVSRFSEVSAIPAFAYPYTIELLGLGPGEVRRVSVELRGERYGSHAGEVRVTAGGADTARLQVRTFIYP